MAKFVVMAVDPANHSNVKGTVVGNVLANESILIEDLQRIPQVEQLLGKLTGHLWHVEQVPEVKEN